MNERAVSVALDYILMLMVATIVLAGVTAVAGTLIDDQVDRGVEDELRATGQTLATDVQDVERLANTTNTDDTEIQLRSDLPGHVSGERYTIAVEGTELVLTAPRLDVEVRVGVATDRLVTTSEPVAGGPVTLRLSGEDIEVIER